MISTERQGENIQAMTDNARRENRRRWVICGTLVATLGLLYVASFAVVLWLGRIEGDRRCQYLTDVSTPAGWQSHQRRAAFYRPMFQMFSQLFGTGLPCAVEPDHGLEL